MDDAEDSEAVTTSTIDVKNEKTAYKNRAKVHRLFYVEHDRYSSDGNFRLTSSVHGLSQVTKVLHRFDFSKIEIFATFGDRNALEIYLHTLFPNDETEMQTCFHDSDIMPSIWAIYNGTCLIFALIFGKDGHSSEKANYFTIVMQRFLQDLCRNILILPSEEFFKDFSDEHSFHSRVHTTRTYHQVKSEILDVQPAQQMKLINTNNLKSLLLERNSHVLISSRTGNTYCVKKTFQEANPTESKKKIEDFKELLHKQIDFETMDCHSIEGLCFKRGIPLSPEQKKKVAKFVVEQKEQYEKEKKATKAYTKLLISNLIGPRSTLLGMPSSKMKLKKPIREILESEVVSWLLKPTLDDVTADELSTRIVEMYSNHKAKSNSINQIVDTHLDRFNFALQTLSTKNHMYQSKQKFINSICSTVQSENQFEVYYDIHRLKYSFSNNDKSLADLTINTTEPIHLTTNHLGPLKSSLQLNGADRRLFFNEIEFIACFKAYKANGEILVMKKCKIINGRLDYATGYAVLFHRNSMFEPTAEFYIENAHFAFACNSDSQTLVIYNIDCNKVTKCLIDDFGRKSRTFILEFDDHSKKPQGVKSLALTVAQDLLVLIDSHSKVFSIDISKQNTAVASRLSKVGNSSTHQSSFQANNGELYDRVQTIGEKNPIFFFQAQSCVDVIDQNCVQLTSISLNQHIHSYHMQIFNDHLNTYCVLFNTHENEAYCIQNLICDTRIERQNNVSDFQKTSKQYVGNRLIDIIKHGEMQFGKPDSLHESHYHLFLPTNRSDFSDRFRRYFEKLSVKAKLTLTDIRPKLIDSTLDPEEFCQVLLSRVPIQLCTIEMGTFIPLNAGRRDQIDHFSPKSYSIAEKVRETSFSCLDHILENLDDDVRIIGVLGRQSLGKSYLMNRIFRTRFAVAAGRCTDGIWMSHAVIDGKNFLVLDCEGLFSDQRTKDEEIKLISYLAAVCDITILSQDLGFSRYLDRLFSSLSKAIEKIGRNDKLFQGILFVAVRDISDNNGDESADAAEQKFLDLQKRNQCVFLEELFSRTLKIQPLHHFENQNFDKEIDYLRDLFAKYEGAKRWENGKELAERLKILLIQLYTDDFLDSNEIHEEMKLTALENQAKCAWLTFEFQNESNEIILEQAITKSYGDKSYSIKLNHSELQFDENQSEKNFNRIYKFVSSNLTDLVQQSKEEMNKILTLIDDLIADVLIYHRTQVKKYLRNQFQKMFRKESETVNEQKAKLLAAIDQYISTFKLQICLKKCHNCELKCQKNAQHTEEIKAQLEQKKEQLRELKTTLHGKSTDDQQRVSMENLDRAKQEANNFVIKRIQLDDELKFLKDKEKVEDDLRQSELQLKMKEIVHQNLIDNIHEIEQKIIKLFQREEDFNILLEKIKDEMMKLLDSAPHKLEKQKELMMKFHAEISSCVLLISFDYTQYQNETPYVFDSVINAISTCIEKNIKDLTHYRDRFAQSLQKIEQQQHTEKQRLEELDNWIETTQQTLSEKEQENAQAIDLITKHKTNVQKLNNELNQLYISKDDLSQKLTEESQDPLSDIDQIQHFLKALRAGPNQHPNSQHYSESKSESVSTITSEIFQSEEELSESFEVIYDSLDMSEVNPLINDQITEATNLLIAFQSLDEKIVKINKKLTTARMRKFSQEKMITKLQADADPDTDGIAEAQQELEKVNGTVRSSEEELNNLCQKKASIFNTHSLINPIRQMFQSDCQQQRQRMQTRLEKVSEVIQSLNQSKEKELNYLDLAEQQRIKHDRSISYLANTLKQHKIEQETYQRQLQCNDELYRIGTELNQLLINSDRLLQMSLKRFHELWEAKKLIDQHQTSTTRLKSNTDEFTHLKLIRDDLSQKLDSINSNSRQCFHQDSRSCQTAFEATDKSYHRAHSDVQNLEKELVALDKYSILQNEIEKLEKEAQQNCTCGTDHRCSGICQICAAEDESKQKPCILKAGHTDQHKCDDKHICINSCQICQIHEKTTNQCQFTYGHTEPSYHQCKRDHQCPKTCSICPKSCTTPLKLEGHEDHRCNSQVCWKPCIFFCEKICVTEDHNHDATASVVVLSVGETQKQMKRHLCDQPHHCKGICNSPGVCTQDYKTQQATYRTESGEEFPYERIEVNAVRRECEILIAAGKASHEESEYHQCRGQHTCPERCPDCNSFCRNPDGHNGNHRTLHRNKDLHYFTSTHPTDQIKIFSTDKNETRIRKYKVGESAEPEKCCDSCKRRSRSHFHLVECPGGSECWQEKLPSKAKHSNETYYLGVNNPSAKRYDQILCSAYWSLMNWISPVNDNDRKLIDSCNAYCSEHVERNNDGTVDRDKSIGFCMLEAEHAGDHKLECQDEHPTSVNYEGVDICFVIDTTDSMSCYFDEIKRTIIRIIHTNAKKLKEIGLTHSFQFAIVDYRDHPPEGDYVTHQCDFTDQETAINYVTQLKSGSGGDTPEAVLDGLDAACKLKWRDKADHLLFHVLDAPPHGREFYTGKDRWPRGCPCGKTARDVLLTIKKKKIDYHVLYCSNTLNMMISKFEKYITLKKLEFNDEITFDAVIAKQVYRKLVDTEMTLKKTV